MASSSTWSTNELMQAITHAPHDDVYTRPASSALLSLPPEIRNTIWKLVLFASQHIKTIERRNRFNSFGLLRKPSPLELLRVCRVINTEAAGFYYRHIQLRELDCPMFWHRLANSQLRLRGITQLTIACQPLRHQAEAKRLTDILEDLPNLPNLVRLTMLVPSKEVAVVDRCRAYDGQTRHFLAGDGFLESLEVWKADCRGVEIRVCFEELPAGYDYWRAIGDTQVDCQTRAQWVTEAMTSLRW